MKRTTEGFSELQTVAKAVGFLAVLTGALYLRARMGEGTVAFGWGGVDGDGTLLLFLMLATAGLLAAWWHEVAGGAIAALSALGVAGIVYGTGGPNRLLEALVYGSPFLIAGSLFLACGWRARNREVENER